MDVPIPSSPQLAPAAHPTSVNRSTQVDLDSLVHATSRSKLSEALNLDTAQVHEVNALVDALAQVRESERELSEALREHMGVSAQEMHALQFMVLTVHRDSIVTPTTLAKYLRISAASTTKLLNRLEHRHYITRALHPHDRRALKLEVTAQAQALVQRAVGRQQARRVLVASQLSSEQRRTVTEFLRQLTRGIDDDHIDWADTEVSM